MRTEDQHERIHLYTLCLSKGGLVAEDAAGALNNRGVAYEAIGEADKAFSDFNDAIADDPTWGMSYLNRGRILMVRGQPADAEADFDKAIRLQPSRIRPFALYMRGEARRVQGKLAGALQDYEEATQRDTRMGSAYFMAAWILAAGPDAGLRNGSKAVEMASKAVGVEDNARNRDVLAAAYAEAGKFDDAVREQTRAIALAATAPPSEADSGMSERLSLYRSGHPFRISTTQTPGG
jgi:tetratricopeptide (TPR) repeat protein